MIGTTVIVAIVNFKSKKLSNKLLKYFFGLTLPFSKGLFCGNNVQSLK